MEMNLLPASELTDGGVCSATPGGAGDYFPPGDLHRRNISFFLPQVGRKHPAVGPCVAAEVG